MKSRTEYRTCYFVGPTKMLLYLVLKKKHRHNINTSQTKPNFQENTDSSEGQNTPEKTNATTCTRFRASHVIKPTPGRREGVLSRGGVWEGDVKTDESNKSKCTSRTPQVVHHRPLWKRKSHHGLEAGRSHPHRGWWVSALDRRRNSKEASPEDHQRGCMLSATWSSILEEAESQQGAWLPLSKKTG